MSEKKKNRITERKRDKDKKRRNEAYKQGNL